MVEQHALVIVHVAGLGRPGKEVARELQHVVHAAVFRSVHAELGREHTWIGSPQLEVTGAAGAVRALTRDFVPEIIGDVPVTIVSGEFIQPRRRDHLRNVCVHMQAFQFIAMCCQRIEESFFIEALRQSKVFTLSRHAIKVGQHFSHATIFDKKHALHLLFAQRVGPAPYPSRHLLDCVQRLLVSSQHVHIEMARHDFVESIEGGPHIHAIAEAVVEFLGIRAEITILELRLTFSQFSHHQVAFTLEFLIARTGKSQRACRKIMSAGKVAAQFRIGLLPVSQRICRRG